MNEERDSPSSFEYSPDEEHDPDDVSSDHPDEKWLVSYADLMTLLFGLFVMLYTMAMETQGKPEKYFSDLANVPATKNDTKSDTRSEPKPATESESKENLITQLKAQLQQASTPSEELKKSVQESRQELTQSKEQQTRLLAEIERLKQLKSDVEQSKTAVVSEEKVKFRKQIETMQKKLNQMSNQQDQLIAEKTQMEKEISDLKDPKRSVAAVADIAEHDQKIELQKNEIENLQEKISELSKQNMESFMIVMLKWETEKHDLDLIVTDPTGRIYSFNKRGYKESPAKFMFDSRTGPGIEMWQTPVLIPGDYQIDFVFYNNYGNTNPAVVSGSIVTKRGEIAIPAFKLDFAQRKKSFKLRVKPEGLVTVQ